MKKTQHQTATQLRRGFLAPLVAFALVTVMASLAFVLDRFWMEAALVELQTCADTAAFAAGHELACDDLLNDQRSPYFRIGRARKAAVRIAASNPVAGSPVLLDPKSPSDICFGKIVRDPHTHRPVFLKTNFFPTTVVVTARRTRRGNNPVALLFRTRSGETGGDAVARAEVSLDNHITGLRPSDGTPIPALPLAILRIAAGDRSTWHSDIEQKCGFDQFAFCPEPGAVIEGSDGLPELTLDFAFQTSSDGDANVKFADLGAEGESETVIRQISQGISRRDLSDSDGVLTLYPDLPILAAIPRLSRDVLWAFSQTIGVPRICLLYDETPQTTGTSSSRFQCSGLVAVRVMDVRERSDGRCQITVQPTVLTTRTALLATEAQAAYVAPNPYVYKLHLTQ